MKKNNLFILLACLFTGIISCSEQSDSGKEELPLPSVKTTFVCKGDIQSLLSFTGKVVYLKKNQLVSPISGYIVGCNVKFGDVVKRNDVLFEIQTKERKALENTTTNPTNLGVLQVKSPSAGYVNELNVNGTGAYISEGASLCKLIENNDLTVQANIPFEYRRFLKIGSSCKVLLSDHTIMDGHVYELVPIISESAQTQNVLIKLASNTKLPENLNLTVQFVDEKHQQSNLVPKAAVMTDEKQGEFWLMKIVDKGMAVKVPIQKGIENDSVVEVISPSLSTKDIIIIEGAYGLPDSTVVKVVN